MNGVRARPSEGSEEIRPCSGNVGCCGCGGVRVGRSEGDGPIADGYAGFGIDK
jgi:hypothetical protein